MKEKTIVKIVWGSDWKAYVKKNALGAYVEIDWGAGLSPPTYTMGHLNDLIHIVKDENELAFYKAIMAEMNEAEGKEEKEKEEEPRKPAYYVLKDGAVQGDCTLTEDPFEKVVYEEEVDIKFLKELVDEHDASINGFEDIYIKFHNQIEERVNKQEKRIKKLTEFAEKVWMDHDRDLRKLEKETEAMWLIINKLDPIRVEQGLKEQEFEKEQEKQGDRLYHVERRQDHHTGVLTNLELDMDKLWKKIGEMSRRR